MVIRTVLVEDHHLVRAALRQLVEGQPDLRVVAEGASGPEALALVAEHHPDVLVLDLMLPGMSGLAVARYVAREWPETKVVVLSMHANEGYIVEALRSGALGYVLKDALAGELFTAIRRAAAGRRYLSGALSDRAIEAFAGKGAVAEDPLAALSEREREALHFLMQGLTTARIAERMFISPRTAEKHRAAAMKKLGLRTQQDLVRFGIDHGLIPSQAGGRSGRG